MELNCASDLTLRLNGIVNQAILKLSAGFSNAASWTSKTYFVLEKMEADHVHILFNYLTTESNKDLACSVTVGHPNFCLPKEKIDRTVCQG